MDRAKFKTSQHTLSPILLSHSFMKIIKGSKHKFITLLKSSSQPYAYPLFRDDNGDEEMLCVSPQHGRSYIVGKNGNRWIISKGNGLNYSTKSVIKAKGNTDVWGLLEKASAIRDFNIGNEVNQLGIHTNIMEAVLQLNYPISIDDEVIYPYLLQYSVNCPYRISDAPFMEFDLISHWIKKWDRFNSHSYHNAYLIAADVIFSNLQVMHDNGILHNAISSQNLTWDLELLDFELASSPKHPYSNEEGQKYVQDLFEREVIYAYQIVLDIAAILKESIDYTQIERIIKSHSLWYF